MHFMHYLAAVLLLPMAATSSYAPILAGRASTMRTLVTTALQDDDLSVPGVLWLEHLNLVVGDEAKAFAFYRDLIGFVAEPGKSFHLNLGSQQLHLESNVLPGGDHPATLLTGTVGLAVPSLEDLRSRCKAAQHALSDSKFGFEDHGDSIALCCPWGNSFICHEAVAERSAPSGGAAAVPRMEAVHCGLDASMAVRGSPGIRYCSFRVRPGTAQRIGLFYEEMLGCSVTYTSAGDECARARTATVAVGPSVHFVFLDEDMAPLSDQEERWQAGPAGAGFGLHVCVYISDFKHAYNRMHAKGLVWTNPRFSHLDRCDTYAEAVASRQFRFRQIVDVETGAPLLELEHEVRAQRHVQFFKRVKYP